MSLTALQSSAYLHHIHFHSPDPERLARWYGSTMNMQLESLPRGLWLTSGPSRQVLF